MVDKNIFRKRVPSQLKIIIAILILAPVMLANGAYTGSSVDISGALGVMSEDINMSYFITSAGMSIAYPLILKIRPVVTTKIIVISSLIIQIIFSFMCIHFAETDNMLGLGICSFFIGFFKAFVLLEIIGVLMMLFKTGDKRSIFYAKFYPISIGISQLSLVITAELAYNYNWEYMYYLMIMMLLFAIILVLLCFRYSKMPSLIPFKNSDWISVFMISVIYTALIFVLTYGKTYDWFSSDRILICSVFVIPIMSIFFIRRQLLHEDSYLDLSIFKNKNTVVGYIFIIISMLFVSVSTLISSYAMSVLKLENARLNELYLWSIPGFIVGSFICIWWFQRERHIRGIFFLGFFSFFVAFLILYFTMSPTGSYENLYFPMFLRGIGMLILFVSFAIYVVQGLPVNKMIYNAFFLIGFRSAVAPAIAYSIFSNWLYRLQTKNTMILSETISHQDPIAVNRYNQFINSALSNGISLDEAQKFATTNLYNLIQIQSLTLTLKIIIGWMLIVAIIVLVVILLYPFNNHKRMKFIRLGNDMG